MGKNKKSKTGTSSGAAPGDSGNTSASRPGGDVSVDEGADSGARPNPTQPPSQTVPEVPEEILDRFKANRYIRIKLHSKILVKAGIEEAVAKAFLEQKLAAGVVALFQTTGAAARVERIVFDPSTKQATADFFLPYLVGKEIVASATADGHIQLPGWGPTVIAGGSNGAFTCRLLGVPVGCIDAKDIESLMALHGFQVHSATYAPHDSTPGYPRGTAWLATMEGTKRPNLELPFNSKRKGEAGFVVKVHPLNSYPTLILSQKNGVLSLSPGNKGTAPQPAVNTPAPNTSGAPADANPSSSPDGDETMGDAAAEETQADAAVAAAIAAAAVTAAVAAAAAADAAKALKPTNTASTKTDPASSPLVQPEAEDGNMPQGAEQEESAKDQATQPAAAPAAADNTPPDFTFPQSPAAAGSGASYKEALESPVKIGMTTRRMAAKAQTKLDFKTPTKPTSGGATQTGKVRKQDERSPVTNPSPSTASPEHQRFKGTPASPPVLPRPATRSTTASTVPGQRGASAGGLTRRTNVS